MVTRYQFVTRRSLRTSGAILPGSPARIVRVDVAGERRWLAGSVP
jgi:hypothetical protein